METYREDTPQRQWYWRKMPDRRWFMYLRSRRVWEQMFGPPSTKGYVRMSELESVLILGEAYDHPHI